MQIWQRIRWQKCSWVCQSICSISQNDTWIWQKICWIWQKIWCICQNICWIWQNIRSQKFVQFDKTCAELYETSLEFDKASADKSLHTTSFKFDKTEPYFDKTSVYKSFVEFPKASLEFILFLHSFMLASHHPCIKPIYLNLTKVWWIWQNKLQIWQKHNLVQILILTGACWMCHRIWQKFSGNHSIKFDRKI